LRVRLAVILGFCIAFCGLVPAHAAGIYDLYPVPANTSLAGKLIILDPGHGAGYGGSAAGYVEHVAMLRLAELLKADLERCGASVMMTRATSVMVNNYVRMAQINLLALGKVRAARAAALSADPGNAQLRSDILEIERLEDVMQNVIADPSLATVYFNSPYDYTHTRKIHPDLAKIFAYENDPAIYDNILLISLHSNAPGSASNTSVNGMCVYMLTNTYPNSANYYASYANPGRSRLAAELLLREVTAAVGFKNNGININDFFNLRESNLPTVLLELGFHTNPSDRAVLSSDIGLKRIAAGITYAVGYYFNQISPPLPPGGAAPALVTSDTYTLAAGMISGVVPGTTAAEALSCFDGGEYALSLLSSSGAVKADGPVVTGDRLVLTDADGGPAGEYLFVLYGDVSGDGRVSLLDLLIIQKYLLKTHLLLRGFYSAADVNRDGKVSLVDLLIVQKYLLRVGTIDP
jgi:N-acetylmuramoyl-L-alanine amidase